jgi:DNA-binding NarL/FixJ family response regulator
VNKTVLIVDDEPGIHELLKIYLSRMNSVSVASAYSGEEGVKMYMDLWDKGKKPQLVTMDLNLSNNTDVLSLNLHKKTCRTKMDGVQATQEILKKDPSAVIWGYTAWYGTEWAEKLGKTGAKKVVDRSVSFKRFSKMIHKYLK